MAGMFYSIKEVSEKLGKSEDEVRQLVKAGRLREFRDGPNLLFKVDEVTALMSDTGAMPAKKEADKPVEPVLEAEPEIETPAEPILEEEPAVESAPAPEAEKPVEPILEAEPEGETPAPAEAPAEPILEAEPEAETPAPAETPVEPELVEEPQAEKPAAPAPKAEAESEEILLAPETPEKQGEEIKLTDADTQIVEEGIKVLGGTDTAGALGGDTGGETFKGLGETPAAGKEASLEEIEKDVSLDTFGSGSGLLDLSLQADDTSLGGILDEIYTTPGEEGKAAAPAEGSAEGSAMEVAAEADQILSEGQFPEPQFTAPAVAAGRAYAEPAPDAMSNAMGIMLFIPLIAVIYTAIVAVAGFSDMIPAILKPAQGYIWYITGGLAAASLLIAGIGATMGGEKKPKTPKVKKPKPPKVKKEKPPKPKKEKKGK